MNRNPDPDTLELTGRRTLRTCRQTDTPSFRQFCQPGNAMN